MKLKYILLAFMFSLTCLAQNDTLIKRDSLIVDEVIDDDYEYYKDKVFPDDKIIYGIFRYEITEFKVGQLPFGKNDWELISKTTTSYIEINEEAKLFTFMLVDLKLEYKMLSFEMDEKTDGLFYYNLLDRKGNEVRVATDTHKTFFMFRYPSSLVLTIIKE